MSLTYRVELWPMERFVLYDAVVGRMCASIPEFGFKIPVLAQWHGCAWTPAPESSPQT